jgi:hypothetical protein
MFGMLIHRCERAVYAFLSFQSCLAGWCMNAHPLATTVSTGHEDAAVQRGGSVVLYGSDRLASIIGTVP